jgi:DNA-binding CsgD family transcriptional regulator
MEDQVVDKIAREQYMNMFADIEKKILHLKMQGYTMREIAKKLNKNWHTLKTIFNNTTHNASYKRVFNEIF